MLRLRAPFLVTVAGTALWLGCGSTPRDQNIGMDATGYEPPIYVPPPPDASDAGGAGGSGGEGGSAGAGDSAGAGGSAGTGGGAGGSAGAGGTSGAAGTNIDGASDAISDAGAVG